MNTYTIWAVQVLSSSLDVEAESVEEAQAIADKMFHDTGELDPENIVDGTCGITGDTEWLFSTQTCGDVTSRSERTRQLGQAVLEILANGDDEDWDSDTLDQVATVAHNLKLADSDSRGLFAITEE